MGKKLYTIVLSEDDQADIQKLAEYRKREGLSSTWASAFRAAVKTKLNLLSIPTSGAATDESYKPSLSIEQDGLPKWKWWGEKRPERIEQIKIETTERVLLEFYKGSMTRAQWEKRLADCPNYPKKGYSWSDIKKIQECEKLLESRIQQRLEEERITDEFKPIGLDSFLNEMEKHKADEAIAKERGLTIEESYKYDRLIREEERHGQLWVEDDIEELERLKQKMKEKG